jgi:hypothetical protein
MALQRSDRLKGPPVVGHWYLVPAILWNRGSTSLYGESEYKILRGLESGPGAKWWPVWGHKHNDIEHFNFKPLHYHIDPRFLTKRHTKETWCSGSRTVLQELQAQPLSHTGLKSGPRKPTLRRMRCSLSHAEWGHPDALKVSDLNKDFAGQQCRSGKRGLVCPHRYFPLGSIEAIDGVVTCPLHGMRIDVATGKCLGPRVIERAPEHNGFPELVRA